MSKAHETRDSLSSSYSQVIFVYLQPIRRNSLLKCASQPKNRKKIKPAILGVQSHSRSSMLISLKSSLSVLAKISSMFVPICNRFCGKWANSGQMKSF